MPKVGDKKFAYTEEGMDAAEDYAMETGQEVIPTYDAGGRVERIQGYNEGGKVKSTDPYKNRTFQMRKDWQEEKNPKTVDGADKNKRTKDGRIISEKDKTDKVVKKNKKKNKKSVSKIENIYNKWRSGASSRGGAPTGIGGDILGGPAKKAKKGHH